jgi:hypothetical protein
MFKALIFGFIVGVAAGQHVQAWANDGLSRAQMELRTILNVDAYSKLNDPLG